MAPDFLHPSQAGYRLWAEAMEPALARLLGDAPIPPGDRRPTGVPRAPLIYHHSDGPAPGAFASLTFQAVRAIPPAKVLLEPRPQWSIHGGK